MKLLFKAEFGPHITYRIDGQLYEVGDVIDIDEVRGQAIVKAHPDAFEVVEDDNDDDNDDNDDNDDKAPAKKTRAKSR